MIFYLKFDIKTSKTIAFILEKQRLFYLQMKMSSVHLMKSNLSNPMAGETNLLKIKISVILFEKHFLSFFLLKFYHLCIQ